MSRLAIITGATSGIGLATAEALAERGYRTVLIGRRGDALEKLARDLSRKAPSEARTLDVTERERVAEVMQDVIQKHGPPDVLINNAGAGLYRPFLEHTLDEHEHLMRLNYFGVLWCTYAVLPAMREAGRGHVINVASVAAKIGPWGHSGYAAAKAATIALTQSLAAEHLDQPIHFSAILPGIVKTAFFDHPSYATMNGQHQRAIPAERVARAILRTIDRPKLEVMVPGHFRALDWMNAISRRLTHRLVARSSQPAPTEGHGQTDATPPVPSEAREPGSSTGSG